MQYTFSENLKYYRERRDMTKKELARQLKVTATTIWMWENNKRYPRLDTLYDISRILNVEVSKLTGENKYIQD